jgi:hypothetical protein
MTTRTRQASQRGTAGRFARQPPATRRTRGPGTRVMPRPSVRLRRRPPQKSGMSQAVDRLTGLLPGSGGKPSSRSSGGSGKGKAGLAALAGAAALAFKNRDRLTSLLHRNSSGDAAGAADPYPPTASSTEGATMQIPKEKILELLRERGQHDQAAQADSELPNNVDPQKDAGLLSKYGIDPNALLGKLPGGVGDKLGL